MKSTALPPSLFYLPLLLIAPFPLDNFTMFLDREGLPSHGKPNQRDEQIQPSSLFNLDSKAGFRAALIASLAVFQDLWCPSCP